MPKNVMTGNTLIAPKTWHHLALVRTSDRVTLYLDGNVEPEIKSEASDLGRKPGPNGFPLAADRTVSRTSKGRSTKSPFMTDHCRLAISPNTSARPAGQSREIADEYRYGFGAKACVMNAFMGPSINLRANGTIPLAYTFLSSCESSTSKPGPAIRTDPRPLTNQLCECICQIALSGGNRLLEVRTGPSPDSDRGPPQYSVLPSESPVQLQS